MITHLPDQRSTIEHYSGELQASPEMFFGRAGKLSPKSWRLTVTKNQLPTSATASVQYDLTVEAEQPESNFSQVLGHFGYPLAGEMGDYSYGFGTAGFITEVPLEILSEVHRVSGIRDFASIEELTYEYSYSFLGEPAKVHGWFASSEEAEAALQKSGKAEEAHCLLRREKPTVEVYRP